MEKLFLHDYDSPSIPKQNPFPIQGVDIQIIDYYSIGKGESYDKHYFILQIQLEDLRYTLDRSYVDFVELDRILRKVFPETPIPILPLRGAQFVEQQLQISLNEIKKKTTSFSNKKEAQVMTRESIISSPKLKANRPSPFIIPDDAYEVIRTRTAPLTLYLSSLVCYHEILSSEPLRNFIDEEITTMLEPTVPPTLTVYDLALLNSPITNITVHKQESQSYDVPKNHILLWRFYTSQFDIGFSVIVNGVIRMPMTRYKASEQVVCGAMEFNERSQVLLKWDNSYAKLYSKNLTWSARIMQKDEFINLENQALDCQKEKFRFEQQRHALRRATHRHSYVLSKIFHGSIIDSDYAEVEASRIKTFQSKIDDLISKNDILINDLSTAELTIEELEDKLNKLENAKSVLTESWSFTNSQLDESNQELIMLSTQLQQTEKALNNKDKMLLELSSEITSLKTDNELLHDQQNMIVTTIKELVSTSEASYDQNVQTMKNREKLFRELFFVGDSNAPSTVDLYQAKSFITQLLHDYFECNKLLMKNIYISNSLIGSKLGIRDEDEDSHIHDDTYTPVELDNKTDPKNNDFDDNTEVSSESSKSKTKGISPARPKSSKLVPPKFKANNNTNPSGALNDF